MEPALLLNLRDGDGVTGSIIWRWMRSSGRSGGTVIPGATSNSYIANVDDINQYLRVAATYEDGRGAGKEAEAVLSGRIGDAADKPTANTAPAFAEATDTRSIGQGTAAGRSIGAAVRATDADADEILIYSLTGQDADKFDIDPATGQLMTKDVLDYDPDPQAGNTYTVTVSVHDAFDATYSPSAVSDATIEVTITVTAAPTGRRPTPGGGGGGGSAPPAPRFDDGAETSRSVVVNAPSGADVGEPVTATHPNKLDITYSLRGADSALFTVDRETGQIQLGQGVSLELGRVYTVNLRAAVSTGASATIVVDIEAAPHQYDLNGNGAIEKNEVLKAVSDYFDLLIEKDAVLEVVSLYFAQ